MWGTRGAACLQVLRRSTQDGSRVIHTQSRLLNHNVGSVTTIRELYWAPEHTQRLYRHTGGSLCFLRSATCDQPGLSYRLSDSKSHRFLSTTSTDKQQNQEGYPNSNKVKVLYDGHCPLCVKEIKLLVWANNKKQAMEFVDISQPDYDPSHHGDVTYSQAMEVMHVIGKDGQVHTRIGAMQVMYGAVGWGWLWYFANLPLIGPLADRAYDWFARNRLWLTGRNCDTGTCNVKTKSKGVSKESK